MLKIKFTNAQVEDSGYGLEVNGKHLSEIISTALGTRVGHSYGSGSGLPRFESNCCNVTVIIDPQPVDVCIENDVCEWDSVENMEADRREQYKEKTRPTDG